MRSLMTPLDYCNVPVVPIKGMIIYCKDNSIPLVQVTLEVPQQLKDEFIKQGIIQNK